VNIGNPHELTILDTARLVRELCGSDAPITFIPRPVDDPTVRQPDITVARERLGWEPNVSVGDGLARTIAWFEHELVGAGQRPAA
jgi:dTDP-glucose 4,6-dehydratase